ncbi:hypothetical protein J4477_03350 [Candidatus Pacearchaeota archaeon]|nr:hypothetical protein [Candidatus Pacearchaeota archaeon]
MRMMKGKKFPILAVILLAVGIVWLIDGLGYLIIPIPWLPIVLIVIAVGLIVNRYMGK